jgi:LEA14-like dessication related protein
MTLARPLLFLALPAALSLGACSKPEPPTVTPISGRVVSISSAGMNVEAKLEAYNPNDFDMTVKSFTAAITLDHQYNVGTVTAPHALKLPAKKKKTFDMPMSLKWNDVAAIGPLALQNRDVPWEAEGTVKVTAEDITVEVPFKVGGTVTHKQIVDAVGKSIPKIPGLPF